MTKKEQHEKVIFDYFERNHPNLAGRKVSSAPGNNPPDILCIDDAGKRIGVELGEWIKKEQMKAGKDREAMEKSYRSAIRSREVPHPSKIGMVQIGVRDATKVFSG